MFDTFFRSCVRILGYDTTATEVDCRNGHVTKVHAIPIGVDVNYVKPAPLNSTFLNILKEKFKDKKVIFSRDTLEPIKGIPLKFKAFEKFLIHHPEWIGKVVLIQLITPPNNRHCSYSPRFGPSQEAVNMEQQTIDSPTTERLQTPRHTRAHSLSASFPIHHLPSSSSTVFTKPSSPPSLKNVRNLG